MSAAFLARLQRGELLLLDGAMGTELMRRGVDTSLPLWSARALLSAPDVVRAIHADYVRAGADVITTNPFRTHRRSLAKAGLGARAQELTQLAVHLAREAAGEALVAGSIAPLEDCYSPALVPSDAELIAEHGAIADHLARSGCDLLLVETMNCVREAAIATRAAQATRLPVAVSFVVGPGGKAPGDAGDPDAEMLLLSGEPLSDAVAAIAPLAPAVLMVNCVPLASIERAHQTLRASFGGRTGLYANVGRADAQRGWLLGDDVAPDLYARCARRWRDAGASVIGGCCGTRPEHIAALARQLRK
ncbi:MAG: homocysteine S-methyltransferase family protein [Planctomycetota bacterium]